MDILSSLRIGESVVLRNAYLTRGGNKVRIYAARRIRRCDGEFLIILANTIDFDCTERLYRKRSTLETAFRELKSAGFNMEDTHLNDQRFENMLSLLMIAFAPAFLEGLIRIESLPIPLKKIKKKDGVKRIRIFRYGYVSLLHESWQNIKI